jgi:hypothetical protein
LKALSALPDRKKIQQDVEKKLIDFGHTSLDTLLLT